MGLLSRFLRQASNGGKAAKRVVKAFGMNYLSVCFIGENAECAWHVCKLARR